MFGGGPAASAALWRFRQIARTTSVRAGLFVAFALVTALAGYFLKPYIPDSYDGLIGASAAESLLGVLASSLLSVATFTLGVMVNAYNSAASAATPRATPLIVGDVTSQNVLSVFVGAFVFAIVGLVLLHTGVYGGSGRVVLFVATILVLLAVVVALLRWIHRLSGLGRLSDAIDLVEAAARESLESRIQHPHLGAQPLQEDAEATSHVYARDVGYVQHVDIPALQKVAKAHGLTLYVHARPGALVAPAMRLAAVVGEAPPKARDRIAAAFRIGVHRTFYDDPRFGFLVLSEIASKALSPGINDPGTALDVTVRATRLLTAWAQRKPPQDAPAYDRVHVPELKTGDLFDDAFDAIERDGAALVEVAFRVQTALSMLAASEDAATDAAARRHSARALARARAALTQPDDLARVEAAAIAARPESA